MATKTKSVKPKNVESTEVKQEEIKSSSINSFTEFMKLICLKGHVVNVEGVFDIQADKISTTIKSSDGTFGLRGVYQGKFDAIGKVGLLQLQRVLKYVVSFTEPYSFEFTPSKLIFKTNKRKISVPLQKSDTIVNQADEAKFQKYLELTDKGIKFILSKDIIKSIVDNFLMMEAKLLTLSYKEEKLTLQLNHESSIFSSELLESYDINLGAKPFSINISRYLIEALSTIDDAVQIQFPDTEKPNMLIAITKKANIEVDYVVNLLEIKK